MTTVTWGVVTTYPKPSKVQETPELVGGVGTMADGSMVIDVIATKKHIRLEWQGLTATEVAALYAQSISYAAAAMDMTNGGGLNYGNVIPIPGSASKNAVATVPVTYDFSVEVRTV